MAHIIYPTWLEGTVVRVEVSLFHVVTQEPRLSEVPLFYVTQWEAGGFNRERLKSLDLILKAGGISASNAFRPIHCKHSIKA